MTKIVDARALARHTLWRAQASIHEADPVALLQAERPAEELRLILLFISPQADFARIVARAQTVFAGSDVVACTTAGEIGARGYEDGEIIAIGFPARDFATSSILIEDLDDGHTQTVIDRIALDRRALQRAHPDMPHGFAFLTVDGLSRREDTLTATIAPALRDMPLFGGSAGDGQSFERTQVALNGRICDNAAVLSLIQTRHRTEVFSIDHLEPTDRQMVVTGADPDNRIVKSINAEPAAQEYARIVGKDPGQLDPFIFAAHPVVVRIGSTHHVRAIQRVTSEGDLVFFSAIDEGMVLTVAEPRDMVRHLDRALTQLADTRAPADILGCDCLLRRIEAEQNQTARAVSDVLSQHRVIGFSTYGEQIGALHVNQTMTGVAIYAADGMERV
ncbi:FIST C-terminal domain-containing protein [Sulfitobacter albidus]|uniref:FIST C-terminal domain-containing protein n=1 Tax=Sulfitobacter albidus TaxID=2829501 RepID=A0A975JE21_9RHOB|nr:FIST N-terminal domain-containing protein [Sulfitobacter albidus]QUJ76764.1 FIST C-terminal domain-containing protein [Sulfitobacter albidus]